MSELEFKKINKKIKRKNKEKEEEEEEAGQAISASRLKQAFKKGKTVNDLIQLNNVLGEDMSALGVQYKSSGTASSIMVNTATRILDIDAGYAGDAPLETKTNSVDSSEATTEGLYTGQASYKEYVNKKKEKITQSNAGGLRAGGNYRLIPRAVKGIVYSTNHSEI